MCWAYVKMIRRFECDSGHSSWMKHKSVSPCDSVDNSHMTNRNLDTWDLKKCVQVAQRLAVEAMLPSLESKQLTPEPHPTPVFCLI